MSKFKDITPPGEIAQFAYEWGWDAEALPNDIARVVDWLRTNNATHKLDLEQLAVRRCAIEVEGVEFKRIKPMYKTWEPSGFRLKVTIGLLDVQKLKTEFRDMFE
jgi:hypothetical protein